MTKSKQESPRECKLCDEGIPLKKYFDGRTMHFDGLMAWTECLRVSEQKPLDFKGRFDVSGMFDYEDGPKRIAMKLWDVRLKSLEVAPAKQESFQGGSERKLRELINHMWVHAGYPDNGYLQMTTEQKEIYDEIKRQDMESPARSASVESFQGMLERLNSTGHGYCVAEFRYCLARLVELRDRMDVAAGLKFDEVRGPDVLAKFTARLTELIEGGK